MPKDEELPSAEEGQETVERLGIDVKAWAADIRARVAAAEVTPDAPSSENARMDDEALTRLSQHVVLMDDTWERYVLEGWRLAKFVCEEFARGAAEYFRAVDPARKVLEHFHEDGRARQRDGVDDRTVFGSIATLTSRVKALVGMAEGRPPRLEIRRYEGSEGMVALVIGPEEKPERERDR